MTDILGLGGVAQGVGDVAAASIQAGAENNAISEQKAEFGAQQANEAPWLATGGGALGKLGQLYGINTPNGGIGGGTNPAGGGFANNIRGGAGGAAGTSGKPGVTNSGSYANFYQSPDYQFNLAQGERGVTAAGAAGNGVNSGAQDKAEIGYASGLASNQYDDYKNSLLSLAGLGQTASSATNTATGQTAANISSLQAAQGNNLASSVAGLGKMVGTGITQYGAANNNSTGSYSGYGADFSTDANSAAAYGSGF